ncbi:hypothetical protein U9M48_028196 [Paspalum notatum var. saurae]|uniref:Uncharacterized protein n=1 Tax=Paspalum notatum var. saurae TaxID=547442 RepID=A0AAQ3X188_PASNO
MHVEQGLLGHFFEHLSSGEVTAVEKGNHGELLLLLQSREMRRSTAPWGCFLLPALRRGTTADDFGARQGTGILLLLPLAFTAKQGDGDGAQS